MIFCFFLFFLQNTNAYYVDVRIMQNQNLNVAGICTSKQGTLCTPQDLKLFDQTITDGTFSLYKDDFELLQNGSLIDNTHQIIYNKTITVIRCIDESCLFRRAGVSYNNYWQPLTAKYYTLLIPSSDATLQRVSVPLIPQAVAQFSYNVNAMRCIRITYYSLIHSAKIGSTELTYSSFYDGYRFFILNDNFPLNLTLFTEMFIDFFPPDIITPIHLTIQATSATDQCVFASPTTTQTSTPTTTQTTTTTPVKPTQTTNSPCYPEGYDCRRSLECCNTCCSKTCAETQPFTILYCHSFQ